MAGIAVGMTNDLTEKAVTWPDRARAFRILDQATFDRACADLLAIKALRDEAENTFGPIVKKAHEAHKEAVSQRKKVDDPLNEAEQIYKRSISAYTTEQERIRVAEERRLREAEELRAAQERELEVEEAENSGATAAEVVAIIERPLMTAPVIAAPTIRPAAGISTRETWKAEVTDLGALIKFVAANPQFQTLLQANTVAINGMARSLRAAMKIPGIKVWAENGVAARRA